MTICKGIGPKLGNQDISETMQYYLSHIVKLNVFLECSNEFPKSLDYPWDASLNFIISLAIEVVAIYVKLVPVSPKFP